MRTPKEYAVYKDDEFLVIGTLKEIAEYLDLTVESVRTYKTKKRLIFIELGDE